MSINSMSLFSAFGENLPDEWKDLQVPSSGNDSNAKSKNKKFKKTSTSVTSTSTAGKTPTVAPKAKEVYVPLPTSVWVGVHNIALTADIFNPKDIKGTRVYSDGSTYTVPVPDEPSCEGSPVNTDTSEVSLDENANSDMLEVDTSAEVLISSGIVTDGTHIQETVSDEDTSGSENLPSEATLVEILEPRVSIDTVRKFLLDVYPWMTKNHVQLEYDSELNCILPKTFGKKGSIGSPFVGYFFDAKELAKNPKPVNILACSDGYYQIIDSPIGTFSAKIQLPELYKGEQGLKFKFPKIPFPLLQQIVTFFRVVASSAHKYEAMVKVYYDTKKKTYFVIVPSQGVTYSSVAYMHKTQLGGLYPVVTIHSHPSFEAYFSSTDSADEKATGIYGVIGRLDKAIPDMKFRISCNGVFVDIDGSTIFDIPQTVTYNDVSYPSTWHDNVFLVQKKLSSIPAKENSL